MIKDFDVTQIKEHTKAVVFRIAPCEIIDADKFNDQLKSLHDQLKDIGVKAIFIDSSISVEPLTDELLSTGKLKSF